MTFIKHLLLAGLCFLLAGFPAQCQYNPLWIPDTLTGTQFNLNLRDTSHQFFNSGPATPSMAINGSWWGPTLFFNKGDTVQLHVMNDMMDTTTLHWHGIHLPAMMDGGPHQPIPPMTMWSPYYKVMNNAATYWYHPHLHMMTEHQVNMGLGGLIIIRDSIESSLALPRTYGVDDIPLVLSDRRFDAVTNEIVMSHFGDTMMVNGTLNPACTVPAQIVRFRIVNAVSERFYNLGFSNNASFRVIATDGGLLNAPVAQSRFTIAPGERVEILVNLNGMQGQTLDLVAYNNSLPGDIAGSSPGTGVFANALGGRQFNFLRLNIGAPTANAITSFPLTLASNVFYADTSATNTRRIVMSDAGLNCPPSMLGCGWLDSAFFDMNVINQTVVLNTTEIWEIQNVSNFAHPFHMHNIQFYILDRNGIAAPTYERGWKDVMTVRSGVTARFITRFTDYADSTRPYMYHCHNLFHEDAGMMGQFLVIDTTQPLQAPQVSFFADDSVICAGECVMFMASSTQPVDTWSWNFQGGDPASSSMQHVTVCYDQPGVYDVSLSGMNAAGIDNANANALITVNALPAVSLTAGDYEVCNGDPAIALTGLPAGGTYTGTGVSGSAFMPSSAGLHNVIYIYSDANGCSNSDTIIITVNALPVVSVTAEDSVCLNEGAISLQGLPAGGTFAGAGVSGSMFDPLSAGTGAHYIYYSYVDGNACTSADSALVTVLQTPAAQLLAPDSACISQGTVNLAGLPSGGIFSGNGVAGNIFDPQITGTGNHDIFYIYTDANLCTDTATFTITVNANPSVSLQTPDTICLQNGIIFISGNPPGGNFFGPGISGNTFDPAVMGPGIFELMYVYTDNNNCTGVDTAAIAVENCTFINSSATAGIYIYPNPASSAFNIRSDGNYRMQIISQQGEIMTELLISDGTSVIDIGRLAEGIYTLRVFRNDSILNYRLAKVH